MTVQPPTSPLRISSVDILRALTMLLMIFVNDLWTLKQIPEWLEHTDADADGMGLADTVFPAFLFIVGMSIPFSIQNRRAKGENNIQIVWHIIKRAFALLIMGLFLVNGEYLNVVATGMNRAVWNSICCFSFILLWNIYPKTTNPWVVKAGKMIAALSLLALAIICRTGKEEIHGFQTYWWGILGLIGWAYLVCAIIFTFAERSFYVLAFAWLFFMMLCVASHAGWIQSSFIRMIIAPIGGGSMPAFTMGGILTSMILRHFAQQGKHTKLMFLLLIIALALFVLGVYTRGFWGISKIRATPAWVLICSAITIVVFILLHWLIDLKNKGSWFKIIRPAGTNTLLCYLLPYFAYALVAFLPLSLPLILLTGPIGLLKSFLFSLMIVVIAGVLGKWGMRLRL